MWRTFKRPLYSAASWRVSPILHLSLSFYFDTQFIYAFLFFSRRHTNKADMRSFTTTVAALASVVPAVMSLTINTPYVLSSPLNVDIPWLTFISSSSVVQCRKHRLDVFCAYRLAQNYYFSLDRTPAHRLEWWYTAILPVYHPWYSSSSGMIFWWLTACLWRRSTLRGGCMFFFDRVAWFGIWYY